MGLPIAPIHADRKLLSSTEMTDSKNGESPAATEPNAVEWMQSEIAGLSGWLDPNHCGLAVRRNYISWSRINNSN